MRRARSWGAALLLAGCGVAASADAAVFWVGAAAPCNFNTLQTAIGAVPDGSVLRIASNQDYDAINVTISNKSITLEGGWADCTGTPLDDVVTLTGSPVTAAPVIGINSPVVAREVTLRRLRITGGQQSGIELSGHVDLSLERSIVDANVATTGAGIHVVGVSPDDTVLDITESVVGNLDETPGTGNQSTVNGGGIACQTAAIHLNGAVVRNNHATGSGGGLSLLGCDVETGFNIFQTPELGVVTAVIAANVADAVGGGIHAIGGSTVHLGPAIGRTEVSDNDAVRGGGIYLANVGTTVTGEGLSIDGNRGVDNGGAAFIDDGASLSMQRYTQPPERPDGSADTRGIIVIGTLCQVHGECSSASFNRTDELTGGAFYVANAGLALNQTVLRGNFAGNGSLLLLTGDSVARVQNSLIEGNDTNHNDLVRMLDGSSLALNSSTIAGNATGPVLLRLFSDNGANNLALFNSIIWQPDTTVLAATPADTVNSVCMNAHETESIDAVDHDPGFIDALASDYRLLSTSQNIDACADPFSEETDDLLGWVRPVDLGPDHGDGDFDRGAYELGDRIFADGFDVLF